MSRLERYSLLVEAEDLVYRRGTAFTGWLRFASLVTTISQDDDV